MQMSGRSAEYHLTAEEQAQAEGTKSVAVAVRSGPLLATAFHPELTDDVRWCAVSTRIVLRNFDSVPMQPLAPFPPSPFNLLALWAQLHLAPPNHVAACVRPHCCVSLEAQQPVGLLPRVSDHNSVRIFCGMSKCRGLDG